MKRTLTALLLAAVATSGCYHIDSQLPGVLDLRSDGADAPVETAALQPSEAVARGGMSSFFLGDGATASGAEVSIVDRNHYILGWFPIFNPSSKEEWQAALGESGALRNVQIGDQLSIMAWANALVIQLCTFNLASIAAQTWDFTAKGTRIKADGSPRNESVPPPAGGAPATF